MRLVPHQPRYTILGCRTCRRYTFGHSGGCELVQMRPYLQLSQAIALRQDLGARCSLLIHPYQPAIGTLEPKGLFAGARAAIWWLPSCGLQGRRTLCVLQSTPDIKTSHLIATEQWGPCSRANKWHKWCPSTLHCQSTRLSKGPSYYQIFRRNCVHLADRQLIVLAAGLDIGKTDWDTA